MKPPKLQKFVDAGIIVNNLPMNIRFRNGKPVFFEVTDINIKTLKEYVKKNVKGKKKTLALELIEALREYRFDGKNDGVNFYVHS